MTVFKCAGHLSSADIDIYKYSGILMLLSWRSRLARSHWRSCPFVEVLHSRPLRQLRQCFLYSLHTILDTEMLDASKAGLKAGCPFLKETFLTAIVPDSMLLSHLAVHISSVSNQT